MSVLMKVIATGCYTGYSPVAPGTAGSLFALLLYWGFAPTTTLPYVGLIAGAIPVGIWTAGWAERRLGHDAPQIVIDEMIGMLITMTWLPRTVLALGLGFALFRILDVVKPFPAYQSQRLPGGLGVILDDVIAAVYANVIVRGILAVIT